MRILISRTDSLGDVLLTLPMLGLIKKEYPDSMIDFLGTTYSKPVLEYASHVNQILLWDELKKSSQLDAVRTINANRYDVCIHVFPRKEIAFFIKKTNIKRRVGTTGRWYHYLTCNELVRLSRRRSDLHESQLNAKLLAPLGVDKVYSLNALSEFTGLENVPSFNGNQSVLINENKFKVILHPKSKGSAVEWGIENYNKLIKLLDPKRFQIFVTGTAADRSIVENEMDLKSEHVTDLMGKLSLHELISLIGSADGLVAASTGPLHISGILNKKTIGLFSPRIPIHPGRWQPLGKNTHVLVFDENCESCAKGKPCNCITKIQPKRVQSLLEADFSSVL